MALSSDSEDRMRAAPDRTGRQGAVGQGRWGLRSGAQSRGQLQVPGKPLSDEKTTCRGAGRSFSMTVWRKKSNAQCFNQRPALGAPKRSPDDEGSLQDPRG